MVQNSKSEKRNTQKKSPSHTYSPAIMFSSSCIFLFLVLIMAPSHPINSMSYNYCLKEKNIGEVKQTNKQ